jgi:peptide deformylase
VIRSILKWPQDGRRLHEKSVPVPGDEFEDIKELVQDMFETMYDAGGIGLAGIQIGVALRIFVMDNHEQRVFVNPVITAFFGKKELKNEGCLSLPGIVEMVERHEEVDVEYQDHVTAAKKKIRLKGIEAQCAQHEIDHLDGITIPDKMSPLDRTRLASKLSKKGIGI